MLLLATVMGQFAVVDHGNVTSSGEELHHFRSVARHLRPTGLSLRVLFQAANWRTFKLKINLSQLMLGCAAHRIRFAAYGNSFLPIDQSLTPYRKQALLEFR